MDFIKKEKQKLNLPAKNVCSMIIKIVTMGKAVALRIFETLISAISTSIYVIDTESRYIFLYAPYGLHLDIAMLKSKIVCGVKAYTRRDILLLSNLHLDTRIYTFHSRKGRFINLLAHQVSIISLPINFFVRATFSLFSNQYFIHLFQYINMHLYLSCIAGKKALKNVFDLLCIKGVHMQNSFDVGGD